MSGEVRTGEINDATHKPTTLTDLCQTGGLIDRFCVTCEVGIIINDLVGLLFSF